MALFQKTYLTTTKQLRHLLATKKCLRREKTAKYIFTVQFETSSPKFKQLQIAVILWASAIS